jgi:molecular chaperone DnaK
MVKDAELHAAEDKTRRELVDAKNHGEAMIHTAEKSLSEYGSKVAQSDKSAVESAIAALRTALEGDDLATIKARTEDLLQASMKLGEAMYKAQSEPSAEASAPGEEGAKDDVIDADFKEVGPDDKKKSA